MTSTPKSRKDGKATRSKLLRSACKVFAAKGFRDATVQQICKEAEANPALISYHFGDKAALYEAVWRRCVQRAREHYPVDGGAGEHASAEERFRAYIHTFVRCMADSSELSHLHRLNMHETAAPNPFIQPVIMELRQPHSEHLHHLLRELLGPGVTEEELSLCEKSVVGQCRMARTGRGTRSPDMTTALSPEDADALATHIINFTLAGIVAMRQQIDLRES